MESRDGAALDRHRPSMRERRRESDLCVAADFFVKAPSTSERLARICFCSSVMDLREGRELRPFVAEPEQLWRSWERNGSCTEGEKGSS